MKVLDTILIGLLVALGGDLLYLYSLGLWYDPVKWIEVSEVVLLIGIIVLAFIRVVKRLIDMGEKDVGPNCPVCGANLQSDNVKGGLQYYCPKCDRTFYGLDS